jgi:hypothetical protein
MIEGFLKQWRATKELQIECYRQEQIGGKFFFCFLQDKTFEVHFVSGRNSFLCFSSSIFLLGVKSER